MNVTQYSSYIYRVIRGRHSHLALQLQNLGLSPISVRNTGFYETRHARLPGMRSRLLSYDQLTNMLSSQLCQTEVGRCGRCTVEGTRLHFHGFLQVVQWMIFRNQMLTANDVQDFFILLSFSVEFFFFFQLQITRLRPRRAQPYLRVLGVYIHLLLKANPVVVRNWLSYKRFVEE